MPRELTDKQRIQELQYKYPYHYIPVWEKGVFSQVQYWSWGIRYLGGIKLVLDLLETISFNSLLDIGCGDGRFLREIARHYPDVSLLGIDYSKSAVQIAKAMNPGLNYKVVNILDVPLLEQFDVVTLVEVLEHIPPDRIDRLLQAITTVLNDRGWLIITVPHLNRTVQEKHYQHFSSEMLLRHLVQYFRDIVFVPFDPKSKVMALLQQLIGGGGDNFVITATKLTSWVFRLYMKRFLYSKDEHNCLRIAALCQKK